MGLCMSKSLPNHHRYLYQFWHVLIIAVQVDFHWLAHMFGVPCLLTECVFAFHFHFWLAHMLYEIHNAEPFFLWIVQVLWQKLLFLPTIYLVQVFDFKSMVGIDDLIHFKVQNLIMVGIIFNLFGSFYLGLHFIIMKYILPNLCFLTKVW